MKYVTSSKLYGSIKVPESKSILQRMLIAEYLGAKHKEMDLTDASQDVVITYNALKKLKVTNEDIYLGESGFCLRVLPLLASVKYENISFILENSLATRPILELLNEVGLKPKLQSKTAYSKLIVKGTLKPGVFHIRGDISSQVVSGLLMILPTLDYESIINVSNLKSVSYVELTNDILRKFSIQFECKNNEVFHIRGNQKYGYVDNYPFGDWSSTSFLISAGLITSSNGITLCGLDFNSFQADSQILDIMAKMKVKFNIKDKELHIRKSELIGFEHDFSDCPDLLPAIIPIAINSKGLSRFSGFERLKFKESNRIESIISEYSKAGIKIRIEGNVMIVEPGKFKQCVVNPQNDHRIAMSLAVSALNSNDIIQINEENCINKSYPAFWKDLKKLGANIYE